MLASSLVIYIISVIIMIDNGNSSSSVEITDKYISTRIQNYNNGE